MFHAMCSSCLNLPHLLLILFYWILYFLLLHLIENAAFIDIVFHHIGYSIYTVNKVMLMFKVFRVLILS